ncbi:MAG: hypothetical protein OEV44_11585 [Spirochaetota bacterium]|nr:hypothetical protein [Spirochaetota bacterium]
MKTRSKIKQHIINYVSIISDITLSENTINIIRRIAVFFALLFFIAYLIIVYAHKNELFSIWPGGKWPSQIPYNYFYSVYIAFTFILFYEVLAMIFMIPRSIGDSIGKQYEIMSLIILRSVFEHVGEFQLFVHNVEKTEDMNNFISYISNWDDFVDLIAGCLGSLILFFLIRHYYKLQRHNKIFKQQRDFEGFLAVKKIISLMLVAVFFTLAISEITALCNAFNYGEIDKMVVSHIFFKEMFSIMIFIDILFVLITTRYMSDYHVVFRASGLTISTVVLRLSFSSSIVISVVMATLAVLIGIGVSYVYNQYQKESSKAALP